MCMKRPRVESMLMALRKRKSTKHINFTVLRVYQTRDGEALASGCSTEANIVPLCCIVEPMLEINMHKYIFIISYNGTKNC